MSPAGPEQSDKLHFHYSRADRTGRPDAPQEPKKGLFKRNRGLVIVLLDLLVLLIMFALVRFLVIPGRANRTVDGVVFSLRAFTFDGEVYATVEAFRRESPQAPLVPEETLVTAHFADSTEVTDVLPTPGESVRLRAVYAAPAGDGTVRVEAVVEALGERFTLVVSASAE